MFHGGGCLSLSQPSWLQSLRRKKTTIGDLPEDLLLDVLSLVPRRDLVLNCRLVCSWWQDLVDLPVLWKRKCQRYGYRPEVQASGVQDWRAGYFHGSKRNLVKNPCGEEGLNFWEVNKWHRTEWATIEVLTPPYTPWRDLLPHPPQDIRKCFTLLRFGIKRQRITLRDEGYWDQLMDETRPRIVVKEWYLVNLGSHNLHVKLLSAEFEVRQECCLRSSENINDPGFWQEFSYTFDDYPPGVRYIDLEHDSSCKYTLQITGSSITIDPEDAGRGEYPRPGAPGQLKSEKKMCTILGWRLR